MKIVGKCVTNNKIEKIAIALNILSMFNRNEMQINEMIKKYVN